MVRADVGVGPGSGHDAHEGGPAVDDEGRNTEDLMVRDGVLVRLAERVAWSALGHDSRTPRRRRRRRRRGRRRTTDSSRRSSPWSWRAVKSPMWTAGNCSGNWSRTTRPASTAMRSGALAGSSQTAVPPSSTWVWESEKGAKSTSQVRSSRQRHHQMLVGVAGEGAAVVIGDAEARLDSRRRQPRLGPAHSNRRITCPPDGSRRRPSRPEGHAQDRPRHHVRAVVQPDVEATEGDGAGHGVVGRAPTGRPRPAAWPRTTPPGCGPTGSWPCGGSGPGGDAGTAARAGRDPRRT